MGEGKRNNPELPDLGPLLSEWADELGLLLQNSPLSESRFLSFAKDRGIRVSGVGTGDPGKFHKLGWLAQDGIDYDGTPLFHPFRIYPLHCILKVCALNIAASSTIYRDRMPKFLEAVLSCLPTLESIGVAALGWNRMVDLAILLEPVYWPIVTGRYSWSLSMKEDEFFALRDGYRSRVLKLVASLDAEQWRGVHESLRFDAYRMDENGALYLLLRLSPWSKREKLKGAVSGALWLRHIAEIIRRAFEEVHDIQWTEEDEAFGHWFPGARERAFGSDRPLDHELESRPYLAWEFGLFTGSVVRWYVEGETEYYAIREALPDAPKVGIELVNLRGNIETERDNAPLKLADGLKQDRALRRFSFISFDVDVSANVKAIKRQVEDGNVVGYIAAHRPDFEFANFSIDELIEIAALIDETHGISGEAVRTGDWSNITTGGDFAKRYLALSARRPRSLKGQEWGAAMARYAMEHPNRSDTGVERPFNEAIGAALRSRMISYDDQQGYSGFDPGTFESVDLTKRDTSAGIGTRNARA
ncbi:MAG: hypothetical protein V2A78_00930 [bacterium]